MLVQMLAVIFNLSITVNRMVTRLNDKLLSARKKKHYQLLLVKLILFMIPSA